MQMQPLMAAYYPNNVTTDHIQQVLHSSPFSTSSHTHPTHPTHHTYTYMLYLYAYICVYIYMYSFTFIIHVPSRSAQGPFVSALLVGLVLYATFRTVSF